MFETREVETLHYYPSSMLAGSADRLADELMDHMVDCDMCLNDCIAEAEHTCPIYRRLLERIAAQGEPLQPLLLAI